MKKKILALGLISLLLIMTACSNVMRNDNTNQIAEVWDLEDGCGGKGHEDANEMNA